MRTLSAPAIAAITAFALLGCGNSGTGGGKMDTIEFDDSATDAERFDMLMDDAELSQDAAIEKDRNESQGNADQPAVTECELGYRSCCDAGEIWTEIPGFSTPRCVIVVPAS